MSVKLLETARTRRLLLIEKKRLKEDLREMRHQRMSRRPIPVQEKLEVKPPAA